MVVTSTGSVTLRILDRVGNDECFWISAFAEMIHKSIIENGYKRELDSRLRGNDEYCWIAAFRLTVATSP